VPLPGEAAPAYIVAQVLGGSSRAHPLPDRQRQGRLDLSAASPRTATASIRPAVTPAGALVCEIVMTMFFLIVIMGATDKRAPQGLAPIAIGLCSRSST